MLPLSMNRYLSRLTSSSRGEPFNSLTYPSLMATAAFGTGFALFGHTAAVGQSSLFAAMTAISPVVPILWGVAALITIIIGTTFLLFNLPPAGRASGILGFMVWVFASIIWAGSGGILLLFAVGIPNMWFWIWQYFMLSHFRREDNLDRETMADYDRGEYDDELHPKQGKIDREGNRGVDEQF